MDNNEEKKKTIVEYKVEEPGKVSFYTVGRLRETLKDLPDGAPVVAAPLNENIRVALDIMIAHEATLGEYTGDIAIFNTGLFDIATGKPIDLVQSPSV